MSAIAGSRGQIDLLPEGQRENEVGYRISRIVVYGEVIGVGLEIRVLQPHVVEVKDLCPGAPAGRSADRDKVFGLFRFDLMVSTVEKLSPRGAEDVTRKEQSSISPDRRPHSVHIR